MSLRILLAEDNPNNERVARLQIETLGHSSQTARNGLEVLDVLRSGERFDLILMDIQMPHMDGLEATRRVCAEFPEAARPPIVALTANSFESDREACRAAGMVGFLAKPLRLKDLQEVLVDFEGEVLDRARPSEELEFDFEHFDSLMGCGDEEALEIFYDFCEYSVILLDEMHEAARAGDVGEVAQLAHQLKGSFSTFGMSALSREMSATEVRALAGSLKEFDEGWSERQRGAFVAAELVLRGRL